MEPHLNVSPLKLRQGLCTSMGRVCSGRWLRAFFFSALWFNTWTNKPFMFYFRDPVPVYDSKESSSRGYSNIKVLPLVIQEVELNDLRISMYGLIINVLRTLRPRSSIVRNKVCWGSPVWWGPQAGWGCCRRELIHRSWLWHTMLSFINNNINIHICDSFQEIPLLKETINSTLSKHCALFPWGFPRMLGRSRLSPDSSGGLCSVRSTAALSHTLQVPHKSLYIRDTQLL